MPVRSRTTTAPQPLDRERVIIRAVLGRYGAKRIRVFGSFARGEQRPTSDIDLLVRLPARVSMIDLVGIKHELEAKLGRRVDLVTEDGLSRHLRERVLQEARPL